MSTTDRTERIKEYILADFTLDQVGNLFGLTRERVRQILVREGVTYRVGHKTKFDHRLRECPICHRSYLFSEPSNMPTPQQIRAAEKEGILGIRKHCKKYKHPNPHTSDWEMSQKLVADYKRGMGPTALTKKYGIPFNEIVYHYLSQWQVKRKHKRGTHNMSWDTQPIGRNEEKKLAVVEATKTKTYLEVAKEFDVSTARVGQLVRQYSEKSTQDRN